MAFDLDIASPNHYWQKVLAEHTENASTSWQGKEKAPWCSGLKVLAFYVVTVVVRKPSKAKSGQGGS